MADTAFLPLESYANLEAYTLMPFRFERWADGRVFLSNDAGEGLVLGATDFDKFVAKGLKPGAHVYRDLLSRQMLRAGSDDWGAQSLASKWFTKKSFLEGFTKLHIFVTTLRCNQSCPYCQVSRQGEAADRGSFDMTPETIEKSIRCMLAVPANRITMEFQGGEPLVRFDLLQEAVAKAKKLCAFGNAATPPRNRAHAARARGQSSFWRMLGRARRAAEPCRSATQSGAASASAWASASV